MFFPLFSVPCIAAVASSSSHLAPIRSYNHLIRVVYFIGRLDKRSRLFAKPPKTRLDLPLKVCYWFYFALLYVEHVSSNCFHTFFNIILFVLNSGMVNGEKATKPRANGLQSSSQQPNEKIFCTEKFISAAQRKPTNEQCSNCLCIFIGNSKAKIFYMKNITFGCN